MALKSCAQGAVILVSLDRSSNPKAGGTPPLNDLFIGMTDDQEESHGYHNLDM